MTIRADNTMSLDAYRRELGLGPTTAAPRITTSERLLPDLRASAARETLKAKLTRIDVLMDAEPGTAAGDELNALADEVLAIEAKLMPELAAAPREPDGAIRIVIPGPPVAFARAGANGTRRYTPAKQARWMKVAQHYAAIQYGPLPPVTDAVAIRVVATFAIPKSWTKARKAAAIAGSARHTSKPDASNLLKIVEDALNGVVFVDDAQVVSARVEKTYGAEAKVTVTVETVE